MLEQSNTHFFMGGLSWEIPVVPVANWDDKNAYAASAFSAKVSASAKCSFGVGSMAADFSFSTV